jgi:hypothetical protein
MKKDTIEKRLAEQLSQDFDANEIMTTYEWSEDYTKADDLKWVLEAITDLNTKRVVGNITETELEHLEDLEADLAELTA